MHHALLLLRRIRPLLAFGCFFLLAAYLKAYLESRSAYLKAESLLSNGKIRDAVRQYSYALRWYTPGSAYPHAALRRISRLGELAYASGDWDGALFCFQQLHASLASLRSLWQPFSHDMKQTQERLFVLLDFLPSRVGPLQSSPLLRQERFSSALLSASPPPLLPSAAFLFLGFSSVLLLLSVIVFPLPSPSRRSLSLAAFALVLSAFLLLSFL